MFKFVEIVFLVVVPSVGAALLTLGIILDVMGKLGPAWRLIRRKG